VFNQGPDGRVRYLVQFGQRQKFLRILWNNSRTGRLRSYIVVQKTIDASSEDGWTVMADLTDKLHQTYDKIEEKEFRWLEVAEELVGVDLEVQT
jgi:hypothetical protein